MNIVYADNRVMKASVRLVIWRKSTDQYLVDLIKQFIEGFDIREIDFNDILTLEEKSPIIYLSTALDRAIQSYDKNVYYKLALKNITNTLYRIQVKNKNANYYQSNFEQITKITPAKSFILKLSTDSDCKLCFSSEQQRQQCKKIFRVISNQIMKLYNTMPYQGQRYPLKNDNEHNQIKSLKQEIKFLNSRIQKLSQQNKQIQNLKKKLTQTSDKEVRIKTQLSELKMLFQLKQSKINSSQINSTSNDSNKVINLENDKKVLQIRLSIANRHLEQKNEEIKILKNSQQRLKNKISDLQIEEDKLKQNFNKQLYITQKKMAEENRKLTLKYQNLSKQNKKINELNINYENKLWELTVNINNLNQQKNNYFNNIKILEEQLQQLKNLQKAQKLRILSQKYHISEMLANTQQKNKQLRDQLQIVMQQKQKLKSRQYSLTIQVQQLKNNINILEMQLNESLKKRENKIIHKQKKRWTLITNVSTTEYICRQIHKYLQQNQIFISQKIYGLNDPMNLQKSDKIIFLKISDYPKEKIIETSSEIEKNISQQIRNSLTIVQIKQKLPDYNRKQINYTFYKNSEDYILPMKTQEDKKFLDKPGVITTLFAYTEYQNLLNRLKRDQIQ